MRRFVALAVVVLISFTSLEAQQAPALRIVVLEGEGAVNIIQQKTAVRPLVEVRDRNNLPVVGASVTFTVGGGQGAAFAGGVQTLTITTNAAGQAAASGLNAISSGAIQIQVQAAYQGQIATAAISQTNFATAAAAAQAGAGASGGSGTAAGGGAAGGGGGGISATTIGIVGGAVAGGALAVTQVTGNSSDSDGEGQESFDGYNGTLSGQVAVLSRTSASTSTCTFTRAITGPMRIEMFTGNATGRASMMVTMNELSVTGTCIPSSQPITFSLQRENAPVSGGPSALTFSATIPVGSETYAVSFRGSLSGSVITGTVTINISSPAGAEPIRSGSTEMPVTLQR
jgi:hypothetical protein